MLYTGVLILMILFQRLLSIRLLEDALVRHLDAGSCESQEFRDMDVSRYNLECLRTYADDGGMDYYDCLACAMVVKGFHLSERINPERENLIAVDAILRKRNAAAYQELAGAYRMVFEDAKAFPIPVNSYQEEKADFYYENGYGEERNYGGMRSHEGVDIFGATAADEYYPVISVSDGTIEKIGWLRLGGYRIGVRGPNGGYYYYAHLASYEQNFHVGDRVRAGEILGLMGDTGYGTEGTKGKFPVHLHFGIYIKTKNFDEISINPYPVLLHLEKNTKEYKY